MLDDIDRLIGGGRRDGEAQLVGLEEKVWARIGGRQDRTRIGQVRVAAIALALVVGVANGGFMLLSPRPEPSEMRVFTVSAGLSPLSGLDVRG
ncbi:MAG: hypothetical protein KKE42_03085 [Alphaproteobacteria bacterium]|uniref:hypothetical protein n=1 Tax=Brevundimonas sp. TaxID=1871086 RepID=UPI0017A5C000|nr:hypothetical protein [Brevundimonas sp.]MBU3972097.1 hypothetical protein [Alphaproteobacteria bacterium]MBA3048402.1 hypothetical protein [Brevundimonas sp.]MBU3972768.1 hypothetical protein [Alphaproteobacteria bacterium]MBU4041129.1 hypothetical protein [Alphaproteobacteria bacterium]MBU4136096.1 hypothetical protein [Alphaproteobacteria bacterium]